MNKLRQLKNRIFPFILFSSLMLLAIIWTLTHLPLKNLRSFEYADKHASKIPYYITLQSLLASYPLLSADRANLIYLKKRLLTFERILNSKELPPPIIKKYKFPYQQGLESLNLTSIDSIHSDAELLNAVKRLFPIVDSYYLDSSINKQSMYYDWREKKRRILRYNLNGLYDLKPEKYSRILMATNTDWITGSSAGHFILNQTETLDTRFMAGLPMLSALYILPKDDYSKSGNYASPGNWRYFNPTLIKDSVIRKAMDIAGADIFTFLKEDLGDKKIDDTTILNSNINPRFGRLFVSLINNRSYGFAYFANQIKFVEPAEIQGYEKSIKLYFKRRENPELFTLKTTMLYNMLMKLKNKHDVILESVPLDEVQSPGKITINGIVGERASFSTDCAGKSCLFVFNIGAAPGWHAYVNGHESKILRANFAFMATPVSGGPGTVWFIYASASQLISYFASILTLSFIVAVTLIQTQRRKRMTVLTV